MWQLSRELFFKFFYAQYRTDVTSDSMHAPMYTIRYLSTSTKETKETKEGWLGPFSML